LLLLLCVRETHFCGSLSSAFGSRN
jgi:hypothetical protein